MQLARNGNSSLTRAGVGDLRPLRLEGYKRETLRDLLGYDYDDFDTTRPSLDAKSQRRSWWGVYGVLVAMLLVMMATLAWAWVDRETDDTSRPPTATAASAGHPGTR